MNAAHLKKLQAVYAGRDSATHRAVHDAVTAVLALECRSPVVLLGLENLVAAYEGKHDLPEVERAERYLVECWHELQGGAS